jgi:hypothetical protein
MLRQLGEIACHRSASSSDDEQQRDGQADHDPEQGELGEVPAGEHVPDVFADENFAASASASSARETIQRPHDAKNAARAPSITSCSAPPPESAT